MGTVCRSIRFEDECALLSVALETEAAECEESPEAKAEQYAAPDAKPSAVPSGPSLLVRHPGKGVSASIPPHAAEGQLLVYRLGLGKGGNLALFNSGRLQILLNDGPVLVPEGFKAPGAKDFGGYRNKFNVDEQGCLRLKITAIWGKKEKTKDSRDANGKRMYSLFRHFPLKPKKVFFESFSKRTFSDNPKAIYQELVARDLGYECVWGLTNEKTDVGPGGKTVRMGTTEYWYHLATAKYLVCNFNQYRVRKRRGQVMINTMHGVPLKHMGLGVAKAESTKALMRRTFDSWDYFVTPCDYMSQILRGDHYGFTGEFIEAGYPRNDVLIREAKNQENIRKVRQSLGVPEGKKMILWAPTWRTKKRFDMALDLERMREALGDEYVLVLRAHYLESAYIDPGVYNEFVLNGHVYENVNEMLYAADVLVTDYSSIMFDYSLMGRPLILFAWDYDNYMGKTRGVYVDIREQYPELMAADTQQVIDKFADLDALDGAMERFRGQFNQYDFGDAAKKVVDRLWG